MPEILLLGASVRGLADAARRGGWQVWGVDLFADRDLAPANLAGNIAQKIERYPVQFLEAVKKAPNIPWMYTGGLENYPRLIERLAKERTLVGNGSAVLRQVRDFSAVAKLAIGCGLRVPRIWGADNGAIQAGKSITGPSPAALVKASRSSGGLAHRWATADEIAKGSFSPALKPKTYLQEFVPGEACSAAFLSAGGQSLFLGATRQLLSAEFGHTQPLMYAGSVGPLQMSAAEQQALHEFANRLAAQTGIVGLWGADFIRQGADWYFLEVNPRYTASMEVLEEIQAAKIPSLGLNGSWFLAHVRACNEGTLPTDFGPVPVAHSEASSNTPFMAKGILYAKTSGQITATFNAKLDELIQKWQGERLRDGLKQADEQASHFPCIADLPQVGQVFSAGEPIVTLFGRGTCDVSAMAEMQFRRNVVAGLLSL